jgi:hypothetical protein
MRQENRTNILLRPPIVRNSSSNFLASSSAKNGSEIRPVHFESLCEVVVAEVGLGFQYDVIETQIAQALPELQSAVDVHAELEGKPGENSGLIFFSEYVWGLC